MHSDDGASTATDGKRPDAPAEAAAGRLAADAASGRDSQPARPLLVLIDGHALAYRAFHALPTTMTARDGEPTNATFGFASMLMQVLEAHAPDHMAVVFDAGHSGREQVYEEYKATRPEMDDALQPQMERIRELVRRFDLTEYRVEGWEADDIIATLADHATDAGMDTLVVTGDTDLFQIVGPHTRVVTSGKRFSDAVVYDAERITERYGLPPKQLVDWKGLTGDKSDNIPGVPGIGAKTATQLVARYGSVDAALEHIDEVEPKRAREALREHADQAKLSRQLVQIRHDAPVQLDVDATRLRGFDRDALMELFRRLDFRSLVDKLSALGMAGEEGAAAKADASSARVPQGDYEIVNTQERLAEVAQILASAGRIAFDTETTSVDPMRARLVGIAVSAATGSGWYIPVGHLENAEAVEGGTPRQASLPDPAGPEYSASALDGPEVPGTAEAHGGSAASADSDVDSIADAGAALLASASRNGGAGSSAGEESGTRNLPLTVVLNALRPALQGETEKLAHHMKYDVQVLRRQGLEVAPPVFDTMLAAWLVDPGSRGFGLKDLAWSRLGLEMTPITDLIGTGRKQITMADVSVERAAPYACADVDVTLRLADQLREELDNTGARRLFDEVEMPVAWVLADMEAAGIKVDSNLLGEIREDLSSRAAQLEARVFDAAGHSFNLASPQQLGEVLFGELGLPPTRRTQSGYTTAADALAPLAAEHPIVADVLEWRHLTKLIGTYIDALPELINPETGRIHTSWQQTSAVTGRLSSTDPNMQNIPVRTPVGEQIRRAFVAEEGNLLLAADYSQIELRILAALSQDEALLEVYRTGGDIHAATAAFLFDKDPADVDANERRVAKTVNFGTVYGISSFGLAARIGMSRADAQAFIDRYFELYPGVREHFDRVLARASEEGYVETVLGRRRYFPELRPDSPADRNARMRAEREAINAPLQGSAADITKLAMIEVHRRLKGTGKGQLLLQVHDELLLEVPKPHVAETARMVHDAMCRAFELPGVALVVDVSAGPCWADLKSLDPRGETS